MMAIVLTATEGSIVATAMPTIVANLGGFHLFSWAFAAFLLTQAVSIPIYGRLPISMAESRCSSPAPASFSWHPCCVALLGGWGR